MNLTTLNSSGSKASHANNATSQQQLEQEKASGFSLFRLDTIQLWAWVEGHQPLDELSLKSLSEDISYRIREITDNAINYMHHCKRNELKSVDLDNAFHISNIDKTYGFSGKSPLKLNKINADKLNDKVLSQLKTSLFELKDENLELSLEEVIDTSSSTNIILANNQEDAYNANNQD